MCHFEKKSDTLEKLVSCYGIPYQKLDSRHIRKADSWIYLTNFADIYDKDKLLKLVVEHS